MTFPKHKHIKMSQESINQPSSDLMAQTPPSLDKILAMSTPSPPASASAKEVLEQDVEMDIPQNSQVETPANEEHQSTIISEEQADNQLDKLPGAGQDRGPPAVVSLFKHSESECSVRPDTTPPERERPSNRWILPVEY
ncbi:hypothetical protein DFH28DRAFT_1230007 [Melampsora americana]|nr:hypothetical protein DFH28DRAFT_1230007 [Melampsora americana]